VCEETIPTLIPHAQFGAPDCGGSLTGRYNRGLAEVICNECEKVVAFVFPSVLRRYLDYMELHLDFSTALCQQCGAANLFPGLSGVEVFVCRECGNGNGNQPQITPFAEAIMKSRTNQDQFAPTMIAVRCPEKRLLLDGYKIATEVYGHSVRQLHAKMGTTDWSAYDDLQKIAEDACKQSKLAHRELEAHIWDHGC
jgi:hypothetical protein